MKLESVGILIGMRPFNERDVIAYMFARDYGVMTGMLRGAIVAKKNKPLIGQVGGISWNARLDSQLGVFHWEPEKNLAAPLMVNQKSLMFMNSVFALISTLLPEREAYPELYDQTKLLLENFTDSKDYLKWEINLIGELGYAFDLSKCSNCGTKDNLTYLSPKTGRAVCTECAQPYIGRLFELPVDLNVTGKFIDKICTEQGTSIPVARNMIFE